MAAPVRNLFVALTGDTGTLSYVPSLTTLATGSAVGDCICIFVAVDGNPTLSLGGTSAADGWTLVTQLADATNACKAAYFRFMVMVAGTIPALTITSTASEAFCAQGIRIRPATAGAAITFLAPTTASGSSTNPNPPAITNNTGGALDILYNTFFAGDSITQDTLYPSLYGNGNRATISNAANGCCISSADRTRLAVANAGVEDPAIFTRATEQWVAFTLACYEIIPATLTSTNIATTAPTISQSSIGQTHSLSSVNVASTAPIIAASAISQTHNLTSLALATAAAIVATVSISQIHALGSLNIVSNTPALQSSSLAIVVPIASANIVTSLPIVSVGTIGQVHSLISTNLATSSAIVSGSSVGQIHVLASGTVITFAPAISNSAISQNHILGSNNLTTSAPIITTSLTAQTHILTSTNITTNIPTIGVAAISQSYALASLALVTAAPVLQSSTIGQRHALGSVGLVSGVPALSLSAVGQTHALGSVGIATGTPIIDLTSIGQTHNFNSNSLVTSIPQIALTFVTAPIGGDLVSQNISTLNPAISQSLVNLILITSPENILTVPFENRILTVFAEPVIIAPASEERTLTVPFENRTWVIR